MSDLNVEDLATDVGDSSSSSGGGKGHRGKRRKNIYVKGKYGTTLFKADTECDDCSRNAEGLWVYAVKGERRHVPLCKKHREEIEEMGVEVREMDYKLFYAEDDDD